MNELYVYFWEGLMDRIVILSEVSKYFNTDIKIIIVEACTRQGVLTKNEIYPGIELIGVNNVEFKNEFPSYILLREIRIYERKKNPILHKDKYIFNTDNLIPTVKNKFLALYKYLKLNINYKIPKNKNIIFIRTRYQKRLKTLYENISSFDFSQIEDDTEYLLISECKTDINHFNNNIKDLSKYYYDQNKRFTDVSGEIRISKNIDYTRKYYEYGLKLILIIAFANKILHNKTQSQMIKKDNLILFRFLYQKYCNE